MIAAMIATVSVRSPAMCRPSREGHSKDTPRPRARWRFRGTRGRFHPIHDETMAGSLPLTARIGPYLLLRELGKGGMATVYHARDLKHDRPVAFKLFTSAATFKIDAKRFRREIATAARLQHPHICSVYDSGETAEGLWYTM